MKDKKKTKAAKSESGRRLASALIPVFFFLALVAVVAVCAIVGSKEKAKEALAAPAPEPSEAPYAEAASRLRAALGGELVNADNFASLAYKSGVDGVSATVSYYLKSGLLCFSVIRPISEPQASSAPTEDIFGETPDGDSSGGRTNDELYLSIAGEVCACLEEIKPAEDREATLAKIAELIEKTVSGEAKKAQMLYGVYTLTFSYSAADGLEEIVCEPA